MSLRAALIGLPLLFAAPAWAAEPAPVSALVAKVNIPYQQFTLPNGMRVIVHTDRKAPVVAVSIWYHVGSKDEPKGKTGFAHLFEHLMFNGSENSPEDTFKPLQQIGATDVNGTTWYDRTNYFETVPTGALETALFLESDRMGYLLGAVTQQKLDTQRGVVQNEKRQGDNEPFGTTGYIENANLFPEGHPYRHSTIGSMADLNGASLEDVKNWFRAKYGAGNAVLVLAGDVDVPTAKRLVTKWFGAIPRGPAVTRVNVPVPTLPASKSIVIKDRVPYTRLSRHWVIEGVNGAETIPLSVAASALGGLSSSRLDNALVRGEQLAINVSAGVQRQEKVSFFEVKPGQDAAKVAARLDAIIADFVKNGPSEDEVRRVATQSLSGTIGGYESVGGFGGKAVALAEGLVYSGDPGKYKKDLVALAAVTPASVKAAMQKWLTRPVLNITVEPGARDTSPAMLKLTARHGKACRAAGRNARRTQIPRD
jgi:zinc protease